MTYHRSSSRALHRRYAARPRALSGGLELVSLLSAVDRAQTSNLACLNSANAYTAPLDAQTADLAKNWNPTGFYTPAQVLTIVKQTLTLTSSARASLDRVMAGVLSEDARTNARQSYDDLGKANTRALDYIRAAQSAGGQSIDAPGLKNWVLMTMNAASSAQVTAYVLACELPLIVTATISFLSMTISVANVLKKIAGIVLKAGEAVINIAQDAAESAVTIWKIAKWGAIAAAAIFVAIKLGEVRRKAGQ